MLGAFHNGLRLWRIVWTLARYDALFPLEQARVARSTVWFLRRTVGRKAAGRPGQRLADALCALGPSFIKFGQSLAVRSDLIGDEVAQDLSALQAAMPPFPAAAAIAAIEADFGCPLAELFEAFDSEPVAAASIAQVHLARTADGKEVAVKVLRPRIEERFRDDMELFLWLARLSERLIPKLRRFRPVAVVQIFADSVASELDLRMEAAAASELAENTADEPDFHVPAVDWERTSRRVLTLERVQGIPINETERIREAGLDVREILERSARAFFLQVFEHGFFHADMHPGNMFVGEDGRLLPVDFGIMGRLDRQTRYYLADMLMGFLERDYRRVAQVHFDAGYVPRGQSIESFMQALRAIGEPIIGKPLHNISLARLLGQLFEVTERFQMETQPQLLLLQKTMLVSEGVGRRLDPDTNMWVLAQPLIERWMRENRGPEARVRDAVDNLMAFGARLPELTRIAEGLAETVTPDGMRLSPSTIASLREEGRRHPRRWLVVAAALGIGLALGLVW